MIRWIWFPKDSHPSVLLFCKINYIWARHIVQNSGPLFYFLNLRRGFWTKIVLKCWSSTSFISSFRLWVVLSCVLLRNLFQIIQVLINVNFIFSFWHSSNTLALLFLNSIQGTFCWSTNDLLRNIHVWIPLWRIGSWVFANLDVLLLKALIEIVIADLPSLTICSRIL